MFRRRLTVGRVVPLLLLALAALLAPAAADEDKEKLKEPHKVPKALPRIPPPDPGAALVAPGFAAEVITAGLTYPTSIEFDDKGIIYIAEAGPRRPVAVRFSPRGDALYVVDFGAMAVIPSAVGPAPRPFPGTGVLWRIRPLAASRS